MQLSAAEVHSRLASAWDDIRAGRIEGGLRLIDPDVIDHRGGTEGDHIGLEAWRRKWQGFRAMPFREMSISVEHNVVAGDTSVNRYTVRGTINGRSFEVLAMDMIQVRNGRVVEHWFILDHGAMRAQIAGAT